MGGKIETLLEQLRQRQLSMEQVETFGRQRVAAEEQRKLNEAQALAHKQTELTASQVQIRIAENAGDADLARARKQAEQAVVMAEAELEKSRRLAEQTVVTAQAESQQRVLAGRGEAQRLMQTGLAEASVMAKKVASFGDPRLYAVTLAAEHLSHSNQPLVPERVFHTGADGAGTGGSGQGLFGTLIGLMVAEKSGFKPYEAAEGNEELKTMVDRMTRQAMASMEAEVPPAGTTPPRLKDETPNGAERRVKA
jgi:hypothetical protein